jgi:hypothetical protein
MSHSELRNFIKYSARDFNTRHPKFKRNKLAGYRLAKNIVNCPQRYKLLNNIKKLTPQIINQIALNFNGRFVIKATIGKQADRVLCIITDEEGRFQDIMRNTEWFVDAKALITYITTKVIKLRCPHKIIIEEFIGGGDSGIPFDFKVYCVMGKVRAITTYSRGKELGKHMCVFNKKWERIPKNDFYIVKKNYSEYPHDFPLPSAEARKRLLQKAEKLAKKLGVLFCRFDFFVVGVPGKEKIYFGEITPICGGVFGHPLTKLGLKTLYSPKARAFFHGNRTFTRTRTRARTLIRSRR